MSGKVMRRSARRKRIPDISVQVNIRLKLDEVFVLWQKAEFMATQIDIITQH